MIGGKPWGNLPRSDCGGVCLSGAEVLDVASRRLGTQCWANNFVSQGTLDTIDQSRRARLMAELSRSES